MEHFFIPVVVLPVIVLRFGCWLFIFGVGGFTSIFYEKESWYEYIELGEVTKKVKRARHVFGCTEGRDVLCIRREGCYKFLTFRLPRNKGVSPESDKARFYATCVKTGRVVREELRPKDLRSPRYFVIVDTAVPATL